ncbi:MAG TPA: bifunctional 2-polyprenyl-6-hydroxyphenol methylase/3-demethylubiquinol 3-O-methyltransferase UbiG [Kofleriaceae bacterium]|nr:bifunctional 2-polyprenyl-6-hydroxyphenol methylase/3-demethylubiquinol 3-O-methyltransferase UbiG [Kofleriaceae bacterium]
MTLALAAVPIALQALAMVADEGVFHRKRELPRWERIGHPLDTLSIALCIAWLLAAPRTWSGALPVYVGLATSSTLFVTKDEGIHAKLCSAWEHWLHAMLFALHPVVLAAYGALWWSGRHGTLLAVQLAGVVAFGAYQAIYWNAWRRARPSASPVVDNTWYAELGPRWYEAADTPIALLRAEARHRNPWIADKIAAALGPGPRRVLDLGCGAGFLANALAERGHGVVGVDASDDSLAVARAYDRTQAVTYVRGDACALPFPPARFDVVCAMDLLEHVAEPARVVAEAARVLAPGGLLFFHTFNRTWLANLVVVKGVSWFVANAPRDLHVHHLFVKPDELRAMCLAHGLEIVALHGSRPRVRWPLVRMLATGCVGDDFAFTFTRSLALGYTGCARKLAGVLPRAREGELQILRS